VFFRSDSEFVEEAVMPDLFHVVPVGDDSVLNRVLELQDSPLGLGLFSDEGVLLVHADHDSGHLGSSDDGRETGARSIVSSNTGLAHTGTVVNNDGSSLIFSHFVI